MALLCDVILLLGALNKLHDGLDFAHRQIVQPDKLGCELHGVRVLVQIDVGLPLLIDFELQDDDRLLRRRLRFFFAFGGRLALLRQLHLRLLLWEGLLLQLGVLFFAGKGIWFG